MKGNDFLVLCGVVENSVMLGMVDCHPFKCLEVDILAKHELKWVVGWARESYRCFLRLCGLIAQIGGWYLQLIVMVGWKIVLRHGSSLLKDQCSLVYECGMILFSIYGKYANLCLFYLHIKFYSQCVLYLFIFIYICYL